MWRWLLPATAMAVLGAGAPALGQPAGGEQAQAEAAAERAILNGYRRYHATCSHCHGPDGVGSSFGPSLIEAPLPWDAFRTVVMNGKATGTSVMRGFADDPNVVPHIRDIYRYLEGRADGAIGRGRPTLAP